MTAAPRIQSIDLLRGLVMVIMALDHTRDFFNSSAYAFSPEDLTRTSGALFFTRWITHFCAPTFVFLAGVSVYLSSAKRASRASVSRHLLTRGLWLLFVECVVLEIIWSFNFHFQLFLLQVIWVIGWSMIALAGLIWLPPRAVAIGSVAVIALHNTLDGIAPARFGALGWLWNVIHVPTLFNVGGSNVMIVYPLIPWIAVMAAGYCFAPVFNFETVRRRRILLVTGAGLTAAFFLLRALNGYGDPQHWSAQSTAVLSLASFFRVAKYPPSLEYLLMTLGPALLFLRLSDGVNWSEINPLRVYGRVPMFYYLCHWAVIHLTAVVLSGLRYGRWDYFLHFPGAMVGLPDPDFPSDWGYSLPQTYLIWFLVVAALYLPCLWFMRLKARNRSPWLSYI